MLTITDYIKAWSASSVQDAHHPQGFDAAEFVNWWHNHFNDCRELYHVYVLYLKVYYGIRPEDYPGISMEKIQILAERAGVNAGSCDRKRCLLRADCFPVQLKKARLFRGYKTQSAICRQIDFTKQVWSLWELGKRFPSLTQLVRIANFLQLRINYFFQEGVEPGEFVVE